MSNTKKVAKLAKVSVATVSRVINGNQKVSTETRKRVEEAIKSLNYVPNMLARNLRTASSKSILVMVTNISNYFYMETVHGISEYAYEKGYDILLSETNEDVKKQYDGLLKVENRIADGAIIIESTIKNNMLLSLEKKYPVVQCSVYSEDLPIPYVAIDNIKGGYLGTEFLIQNGYKDIAFIGSHEKSSYNADRLQGYINALKKYHIDIDERNIRYTGLSFKGGQDIALSLIKEESPPSAIFFVSDMQAIGAIHGLTSHGYRIPDDVAVLGFDNIELCDMVIPGLTTVAQPMNEIGRESARLLIEKIENPSQSSKKNVFFDPYIVKRGSV